MQEHVKILKDTRIAKGLDISEVSRKTGIRENVLLEIESGTMPNLPTVYLRSFIKKYANFLGLSEDSYSQLMSELNSQFTQEQLYHKPIAKDASSGIDPIDQNVIDLIKTGNYKRLLSDRRLVSSLSYFGIGILIFLIVYFVFFSSDNNSSNGAIEGIANTDVDNEGEKEDNLFDYFESEGDSIILEAFALDSAWMSITMDGKINEEILMKPGMKKIWKAEKFFTLTSGNAGGMKLKRNGEELEPLGARGNVVNNVKITKDEITK
jgi:transcriptional regulator with XRE-family HTH domain